MLLDRRKYARYTTPCLEAALYPLFPHSVPALKVVLVNLSLGGVRIISPTDLPVGEYQLHFTLPNCGPSCIRGQSCYCTPVQSILGSYMVGLAFTAITASDYQKFSVYCQSSVLLKAQG